MALSASRYPMRSRNREIAVLYSKLNVGASGAVTAAGGVGLTVTRTGVGAYTVAINDASGVVPDILSTQVSVHTQSNTDLTINYRGYNPGSANWSFVVLGGAAGTPTPVDPVSGNIMLIECTVSNTGV